MSKFVPTLDRYARMVVRQLRAPTGLVSVLRPDEGKQVFPGAAGDHPGRETPMSESFCRFVVADDAPVIIRDARLDPRVKDNEAIDKHGVIAYAGYPLRDASGKVIGSVCAIDTVPRDWTDEDLAALQDVADSARAEVVRREMAWRVEVAWTVVTALVVLIVLGILLIMGVA